MRAARGLSSGAFRFALLIALVFAIGSAALLVVVARAVDGYTADAVADGVSSEAAILAGEEREGGRAALVRAIGLHERAVREQDFRYLLVGADGRRQAGGLPSAASTSGWSHLDLVAYTRKHHHRRIRPLLLLGLSLSDGSRLVVASDMSDVAALRHRLLWFTGIFGAAIAALALLGGLVVGSVFLRRLDGMNAAIERINGGLMNARLPRIGMGPEFDQLSANLNAMLERIERLVEGLRAVSVGIAHDLRTPLTRLRHRLEGAAEGRPIDAQGALAQIDEILAIFAALLRIGTLESGAARTQFAAVRVDEVVAGVVEAFAPAAEDAGLPIEASVERGIVMTGDRELVAQALTNLIGNAILHMQRGSRIVVTLRAVDRQARVIVEDDGVGVPANERGKVLRRFYRLDRSRGTPGSGLGLSLVAAIAELHGGCIRLEDAGPGLRVTLTFPLSLAPNSGH